MKKPSIVPCQRGFTLIELLITVAISGILMAGVYTAFISQQNSYLAQEQVAEAQQNIRAGLDIMIRDMRMAGYDPDRTGTFGIVTATVGVFRFTSADFDGDGNSEDVSYDLYTPSYSVGDALGRSSDGGARNAIAENIEELEFFYTMNDGTTSLDPVTAGLSVDDIRSVQVSMLARARQPDRNFTSNDTYTTASGATWGAYNDNFRRRFQVMTVHLRNMGL